MKTVIAHRIEQEKSDDNFSHCLEEFRQSVDTRRSELLEEVTQLVDTAEQAEKLEKACHEEEEATVKMKLNRAW